MGMHRYQQGKNYKQKMAKIHLTNVVVLDNPAPFLNPFQFEVTFECIEELKEDLEWKVVYVGSAESEDYDQVLDTILVGPVPEGRHMFVFQAASPDTSRIPAADAVGVTVVLLMCSYKGQEFVRVGYFINNEYTDPEMRENPPAEPQYQQMMRNILATAPRVTRFKIDWDGTGIQGSAGEGTSGCSGEVDQCLSNDVSSAFSGPIPAVMPLGDGSLMDNDNSQSTHNAMEVM